MAVGIGFDQTGIDGKTLTADQVFGNAAGNHSLEHVTLQIAVSEPTVVVLGERGAIWHRVRQIKAAEPAIGQVEMDLFAQVSF